MNIPIDLNHDTFSTWLAMCALGDVELLGLAECWGVELEPGHETRDDLLQGLWLLVCMADYTPPESLPDL